MRLILNYLLVKMYKRPRTTTTRSTGVRRPPRKRQMTVYRPRPLLPFAQAAAQQARILGRPGFQEIKSFDTTVGAAAIVNIAGVAGTEPAAAYTGLTEVNCIPQGATVANRIGNKVVIKSLHLKLNIAAAAAVQSTVRVMCVYDKQPNGAFPAIVDILQDQPAGVGTAMGGLNISNKSRFQVLRDQFVAVDAAQGLLYPLNMYMKGRWECEYGANAGNIGDFRTGSIYVVVFSCYAAGGNASVTQINCRSRYYD